MQQTHCAMTTPGQPEAIAAALKLGSPLIQRMANNAPPGVNAAAAVAASIGSDLQQMRHFVDIALQHNIITAEEAASFTTAAAAAAPAPAGTQDTINTATTPSQSTVDPIESVNTPSQGPPAAPGAADGAAGAQVAGGSYATAAQPQITVCPPAPDDVAEFIQRHPDALGLDAVTTVSKLPSGSSIVYDPAAVYVTETCRFKTPEHFNTSQRRWMAVANCNAPGVEQSRFRAQARALYALPDGRVFLAQVGVRTSVGKGEGLKDDHQVGLVDHRQAVPVDDELDAELTDIIAPVAGRSIVQGVRTKTGHLAENPRDVIVIKKLQPKGEKMRNGVGRKKSDDDIVEAVIPAVHVAPGTVPVTVMPLAYFKEPEVYHNKRLRVSYDKGLDAGDRVHAAAYVQKMLDDKGVATVGCHVIGFNIIILLANDATLEAKEIAAAAKYNNVAVKHVFTDQFLKAPRPPVDLEQMNPDAAAAFPPEEGKVSFVVDAQVVLNDEHWATLLEVFRKHSEHPEQVRWLNKPTPTCAALSVDQRDKAKWAGRSNSKFVVRMAATMRG